MANGGLNVGLCNGAGTLELPVAQCRCKVLCAMTLRAALKPAGSNILMSLWSKVTSACSWHARMRNFVGTLALLPMLELDEISTSASREKRARVQVQMKCLEGCFLVEFDPYFAQPDHYGTQLLLKIYFARAFKT